MQFNVAQLLKKPTGETRKYQIDERIDDLDPDLVIQAPIKGSVKFTKIPYGVLATGRLRTKLELNCNRCLIPFDRPVRLTLEEQFQPQIDLQTGAVLPHSAEDDEATLINEKHVIDLSEVVRQGLLLGTPSRPLCQVDCQGLCPQCGQNLNEESCQCLSEDIDPRWEALKVLLESDENESK